MNRALHHRLLLLLVIPLTSACFLTDITEPEKKKPSTPRPQPAQSPPVEPVTPPPDKLAAARLMRRLSIDLRHALPSQTEIDAFAAEPAQYAKHLDALLATAEAPSAIAALHGRMWAGPRASTPDLDAYVAAGDSALGAALTTARRNAITEEPSLLLRSVLAGKKPFPELFTADYAVVADANISLWGLTDSGEAFPGEPFAIATYSDGRPAAGLLATPGFLASFAGTQDVTLRGRTARMLGAVSCLKLENPNAHLFYDLKAEEFGVDLGELALTRAPCQGCHAHFAETARAFEGLGDAATFAGWTQYAAPVTPPEGYYAGHPYRGLAALAAYVGNDPRTHRCAVEKLTGTIFQRPFSMIDSRTAAVALNGFYAHDLDLMESVRELLLSPEYMYGTVGAAVKGDQLRNSTGIKLLRRQHWRGILLQLSPATAALTIPAELDPGAAELDGAEAFIPTGPYYHHADRLARAAATLIVRDELADSSAIPTRRLFTDLPDGAGNTAKITAVYAQIKTAWKRLTSEELADTSPIYAELQALYAASKPESGPDAFRAAWRTVLVAIMTHPSFLIY